MEPNKPGNKKMPDFNKLSDRIIAEPTDSPFLVLKTNLDNDDVSEDNPYYEKKDSKTSEFKSYFEEK